MTVDLDGPFPVVRRGYDRAQVEERLGKLLAERDAAHAARQSALADLERLSRELDVSRGETRSARTELNEARSEVERLAAQVSELSTIPSTVDGMSDRLQQMVRVAQDEVNDMRARATRGAAQILSMAQAEADELLESSRQQRREFEDDQHKAQDELRVRLEESRTRLAQMREEADGQRARLDAELAERRAHEEQALASDIAERRDVLIADLGAQEKRQRDEAQRIVDAAATQARAVVAEAAAEAERSRSSLRDQVTRAQDELEQLRALQHQIAEQLTGVRSLLDWTLPRVTSAAPAASPGTLPPVAPHSPVSAMPPAAITVAPPTATLPPRPLDDLAPAYADAFDESGSDDAVLTDDAVMVSATTDDEDEPVERPARSGPGFPSTSDVPEPRIADDDAAERPSPIARSDRTGRLAARISSRR
jgi:cell division septum initiation protein DivIVA